MLLGDDLWDPPRLPGLEQDCAQALLGVGHAELDVVGAGATALGVGMN